MICKICGREEDTSHYIKEWQDKLEENRVCHHCQFWADRLEEDKKLPPHTAVMIDGTHYVIGPEDGDCVFRGFGGHRFQIEFNDGHKVVTTNLWCQGEPDEHWKDKFPNNARFENNLKWTKIGECNYLVENKKEEPLPF